jgi:Phosphodiester glycosidase
MKHCRFLLLAIIITILVSPIRFTVGEAAGWQVVAPGVEYQKYTLPDPNNVFVTRMDRSLANLVVESALGDGRVGGRETVSGMARRYDGTINYWNQTWGNRSKVIVAINGSYFDYTTGRIYGGQIHSGWYAKRFRDCETGSGGSGFAFKQDGSVFIGGTVSHPASKQVVTFLSDGSEYQEFQGINTSRDNDELILYTPQYGDNTRTDSSGSEVLVELQEPASILKGMVVGRVVEVRKDKGSTPIPFDHVVLSAKGSAENRLLNYADKGDEIGISHKIKSYTNGCGSSLADGIDWENTYASVDGAFYFLQAGQIRDFPDDGGATARNPRTAVAYNDEYIFFIVVDGRDDKHSRGMTIHQLAEFAKNELKASYGIAQDGGGSSTMVVNGQVVNNTYCNNVDCNKLREQGITFGPEDLSNKNPGEATRLSADGVPLTEQYFSYSQDAAGAEILQRLVANGLMIVRVEKKDTSGLFSPGEEALIWGESPVLLGPGDSYGEIASLPGGQLVTILDHSLNGVRAGNSYWWKVRGQAVSGWMSQSNLLSFNLDEFIYLPLIQR